MGHTKGFSIDVPSHVNQDDEAKVQDFYDARAMDLILWPKF